MPIISQFYGITIKMHFIGKEHDPSHIHVKYGEYSVIISVETLEVLEGKLPIRALKIVKEWMSLHRSELIEIWNTQKFRKIEPLM